MIFDYYGGMNIYVSINGNDNVGFSGDISKMKLTQWSENGHYYLYVPEPLSWSKAYNRAMGYKLGGQQGYLTTITSQEEMSPLVGLVATNSAMWTSGTRLVRANGILLNNDIINRKFMLFAKIYKNYKVFKVLKY